MMGEDLLLIWYLQIKNKKGDKNKNKSWYVMTVIELHAVFEMSMLFVIMSKKNSAEIHYGLKNVYKKPVCGNVQNR